MRGIYLCWRNLRVEFAEIMFVQKLFRSNKVILAQFLLHGNKMFLQFNDESNKIKLISKII